MNAKSMDQCKAIFHSLSISSGYWVIPENIHTIPWAASGNSEGEGGGGVLGLEFRRRGGGGNAVWNSKGMGGCFSSEFSAFPEERRRKLHLKSLTC